MRVVGAADERTTAKAFALTAIPSLLAGAAVALAQQYGPLVALLGIGLIGTLTLVGLSPLAAIVLPLVYVNNPLARWVNLDDTSVYSYLPTAALVGLGSVVALGSLYFSRRARWTPSAIDAPFLVFAAVTMLSAVHGFLAQHEAVYLLGDAFQLMEFILFFLVTRVLVHTRAQARNILVIVFVFTLLGVLTDFTLLGSGRAALLEGLTAGDEVPRVINTLAALQVPVVLPLLFYAARRQRAWLLLGFALELLSLALSFTRGLWLAGLISGAFALWAIGLWNAPRRWIGRGIVVCLVVVLVFAANETIFYNSVPLVSALRDRALYTIQQVFYPANDVQQRRQVEISIALAYLQDSPLFGFGLGATYIGPTGFAQDTVVIGPRHFMHDTYVALAFRMGLLGLLSYLWLAGAFIALSLRALRRSADDASRAMLAGLTAGYIALALFSLTSDSLLKHPTGLYAGLVMALALVYARAPQGAIQAATASRPEQ